ncbi:MAG: hypothetical protein NT018_11895 [Armatimonadetes bacterium]|nr:hypothetical protein [Armatimonadota bacterium]
MNKTSKIVICLLAFSLASCWFISTIMKTDFTSPRQMRRDRIKKLGFALLQYADDNHGYLPPLDIGATGDPNWIGALINSRRTYFEDDTFGDKAHATILLRAYKVNQTLSGKNLGQVASPEEIILVKEHSEEDHLQLVYYLDGHIKHLE